MTFPIHETGRFQYIDEGPRSASSLPIILLHGMLGEVENWTATAASLANNGHRVLIPFVPVYDLPLAETSVRGLVAYVKEFTEALDIPRSIVAGNSLGGHVALLYALEYPEAVTALILSGSSGVYELELGSSMPRRRDREFIRERAALTFYDPVHANEQLIDDMSELLQDRGRVARLIKMARSTKKETLTNRLHEVTQPTLLVWGRNDRITPPDVAYQFRDRIPETRLHVIDRCGHAPMIEHPEEFNRVMLEFVDEVMHSSVLK